MKKNEFWKFAIQTPFPLFVVPDPDIYPLSLEQLRKDADVGFSVMIGEQHLGLHHLGSTNQLVGRHREWLVAGHESDVDVLDVGHLWYVFRIASDVNSQAVDGQDKAIVSALGMEILVCLSGVIGWYGFYFDIIEC